MKTNTGDEAKILQISKWKFRYLWLPILVAGIIILSWNVAISPRFTDISQYRKDSVMMKQKVGDLNQKRNYLLSADEDDLKAKESLLATAIPGSKNVYYLLTVVQSIAQKYDFMVDKFSVSPGKLENSTSMEAKTVAKDGSLVRIPVTVSLLGPKEKYLDMIDSIEHSLPILSIDAFKMSGGGDAVAIDLSVATFFSSSTFNVKVDNLTLADLTLNKDELNTIETLNIFQKLDVGEIDQNKKFEKYDRTDPFVSF